MDYSVLHYGSNAVEYADLENTKSRAVKKKAMMMRKFDKIRKFLIVLGLVMTCLGCTELGDLVVIKYKLSEGTTSLSELDGDFLPKKNWGRSSKCLARRSQVGMRQYIGICFDSEENAVLIYRAFELKFDVEERGVTDELLKSDGYMEMSSVANGVESVLRAKRVKYHKSAPYYVDFDIVHRRFDFTL